MIIDAIRNGIVIDHIPASLSMKLYRILGLDDLSCSVAVLKNVASSKLGRKDIIKIDEIIALNWDVLGYIAPDITVNIIRDGELAEKRHPQLPTQLTNVIFCENPRCITTTEQELPHIFKLTDPEQRIYRCNYCEARAKKHE